MLTDKTKSEVMSDILKDGDFNHIEAFITELPIENKYKKLLILMYANPDPNKVIAFNMGISERQIYKLAEQARICAYDGLKAKIRKCFSCRFGTVQNHSKK